MGRLIQNTISIWYKPPFQYSVFVFQVVDSNHYFSMVYGFISDHHFSTALCIYFIPYSSVFSGLGLDSSADHDISLTKCQRAIQAWNVRLIQAMGKVSASKKAQDPAIHCFWRGVIHQTEKVANKLWGKKRSERELQLILQQKCIQNLSPPEWEIVGRSFPRTKSILYIMLLWGCEQNIVWLPQGWGKHYPLNMYWQLFGHT